MTVFVPCKSLKKDNLVNKLFRNSDPMDQVPELQPIPEVKMEPVEEVKCEVEAGAETSEDMNGSSKKPQFVQVKNREVFDYEPNAKSIHASMWPHYWLQAVNSRFKLRKEEARKNIRFKTGLRDLLQESIRVGTIIEKRKNFLFSIFK